MELFANESPAASLGNEADKVDMARMGKKQEMKVGSLLKH